MNSSPTILIRSLIIYAICIPLALYMGYLIANPVDISMLIMTSVVAGLMCAPLLLRWHYQLMLLSWSTTAVIFFLPGQPNLRLVMLLLSFGISILQHALDRNRHFIYVPQVTWSLVTLVAVVLFTAKLNGGMGFRSLGGNVYGGKHYMLLLLGIFGYFALTARRIPIELANRYVGFTYIGGVTALISDFYGIAPSAFHYLFLIFPPSLVGFSDNLEIGTTRLSGAGGTGQAICLFMLARYGIVGIFSGKLWRAPVFIASFLVGLLGGHRAYVLTLGLVFMFQFFLEGLHRTRWLIRFASVGLAASVMVLPFASKLPFTLQRALSFLPLDFNREALESGESTMEWRFKLWTGLLPQIPKHFFLGKGYTLSVEDYNMTAGNTVFNAREIDPSQGGLALAGDYHNGWLSVIIPFGIWGVIALCWFMWAAGRVLYRNYKFGDPRLKQANTFLLAMFWQSAIMFFGGSLPSDIVIFGGLVGLSVALNGALDRPVQDPNPPATTSQRPSMPLRTRSRVGQLSQT